MIDDRLTILNLYELKKTPEDFEIAVGALARRVEAEGSSGSPVLQVLRERHGEDSARRHRL
ncbi:MULTISPECIES: hypothetical protein [unclassified Mesorhizobium]|uniref:hypothetical protein n=1 Tax=unclassified Mesorhizobium TaxID=325217 RepID=UPI001FDF1576|nr:MULTISPECIES: hypothetical protein [unclassified Mesorhizobium]